MRYRFKSHGVGIAIVVMLASFALAERAGAEDSGLTSGTPSRPWATWLTVANSWTTMDNIEWANALALSMQRSRVVVSLRLVLAGSGTSNEGPENGEAGVVLSYASPAGRRLHLSAGAGVGVADFDGDEGWGIPLEFQVGWRATRVIGLGLYGWGNSVGPHGGIGIAVNVGRLR